MARICLQPGATIGDRLVHRTDGMSGYRRGADRLVLDTGEQVGAFLKHYTTRRMCRNLSFMCTDTRTRRLV